MPKISILEQGILNWYRTLIQYGMVLYRTIPYWVLYWAQEIIKFFFRQYHTIPYWVLYRAQEIIKKYLSLHGYIV